MVEGPGDQTDCVSLLFEWYFRTTGASCGSFVEVLLTRAQKGVMISHRNVIANVLQIAAYESQYRSVLKASKRKYDGTEVVLGVLPQSHIYSLVVICHASVYRGDQVVNLPKFDFAQFLQSIDTFKINVLFLVSIHDHEQSDSQCLPWCSIRCRQSSSRW